MEAKAALHAIFLRLHLLQTSLQIKVWEEQRELETPPSLANIGYHPHFTREGGVPTLEMQVLVPIQDENEFHNNILDIADTLNNYPSYVEASFQAYGTEVTPFVITRAISCFERTLISGNSPYDRYIAGDSTALNHSEIAGLEVLKQRAAQPVTQGFFNLISQ